jgi:large subunit ribosomal protein L3
MIDGLIGKKIGMTHLFGAESRVVPVTVLEVGPCVVTQLRTEAKDGYEAVQIGYGRARQLSNPARGHLRASGAEVKHLHEFGATDLTEFHVGQTLSAAQFQEGDLVDIGSTTKGRGFQGVMKRHGFGGGKKTHGQSDRGRAPGSIGAGTYPGRVTKGKRMPGHMGNRHVTQRKLRVERVDPERNLIMVLGSVPGPRNVLVTVRYAKGEQVAERLAPPESEIPETPEVAEEPTAAVDEVVAEGTSVTEAEEVPADEASADAEPEAAAEEAADAEPEPGPEEEADPDGEAGVGGGEESAADEPKADEPAEEQK